MAQAEALMDSEQESLLAGALKSAKREAFDMKRALDKGQHIEAFKHAASMLSELRTSVLSPKYYYKLYVDIVDELAHLSGFLQDESLGETRFKQLAEFYEVVQYAGNIVPRLYLLITVGVVYYKMDNAPKREILHDLVEMCRGVQHPLRGLFLRSYLLTSTKELLPDTPSGDTSHPTGDIDDSIRIIMTNFSEMNKLWVRMQHQGPSKDREKRERDRRELRILVGTNLVRLSQLENMNLEKYREVVLPGILEQVVSCKEPISQEYLMDSVIQVFPDEYHYETLHEYLEACSDLEANVPIKYILSALIDRLAAYVMEKPSASSVQDVLLFEIFSDRADKVIGSRQEMPAEDIIVIQTALINLAIKCYPDRTDFANTVFGSTSGLLKNLGITGLSPSSNVGKELIKLLEIPIQQLDDVIRLLDISEFGTLMSVLNYRGRCQVAVTLIENILDSETQLTEEAHINGVFALLDVLLTDSADQPTEIEKDDDFIEGQEYVSKLIQRIYNEDILKNFKLLKAARKVFGNGGIHRLTHTLPPVCFAVFKLALRAAENRDSLDNFDAEVNKFFMFALKTIIALKSEAEQGPLALRMYLQAAIVNDRIVYENNEVMTYEFISKAFTVYEEEIHDSREQTYFLNALIGTIQKTTQLTEENYDPLSSKCAMLSTKLLKKYDQALAVMKVAHLFWSGQIAGATEPMHDHARVGECLKKALRLASQCVEDYVQITLYTFILNENLFFYERGCTEIKLENVNTLIDKIRDAVSQLDRTAEADPIIDGYNKALKYIRTKQEAGSGLEHLEGVKLPEE
uniref:Vacuolar protein sorting-associated protein 35 n=1 Tax=Panagrellus redivivus TaxID=6233 RepID=A0A7E4W5A2_PANRE